MPAPKFWAYVQMARVLEARRSLQLVDAMSYAFGSMQQQHANRFIQRLQATAVRAEDQLEEAMRPHRPDSPEQMANAIPGMSVVLEEGPATKAARMAAESDSKLEEIDREMDQLAKE